MAGLLRLLAALTLHQAHAVLTMVHRQHLEAACR